MHYQQGGGKYPIHDPRGSFASRKNWEKCICSGGACINAFGSSFHLNFSCALLPMVSSPFAWPSGVENFGAFSLGCVEPLPLP
jgi:hypothetical protein